VNRQELKQVNQLVDIGMNIAALQKENEMLTKENKNLKELLEAAISNRPKIIEHA